MNFWNTETPWGSIAVVSRPKSEAYARMYLWMARMSGRLPSARNQMCLIGSPGLGS
ncbi:hypothetical protein D3C71_2124480 [compost metagenome]